MVDNCRIPSCRASELRTIDGRQGMSEKAWVQFLLVVVPVMSLIGSWMALRAIGGRRQRADGRTADEMNRDLGDEGRTTDRVGDE